MLATAYKNQLNKLENNDNPYSGDYGDRVVELKEKVRRIELKI